MLLDLQNPPENLLAGMTGEMNIITGQHENALLVPTRAVLVDQVWRVKIGAIEKRTVRIGYRTLDNSEVLDGLKLDDHVVVSEQDKLETPANSSGSRWSKACRHQNLSDPNLATSRCASFSIASAPSFSACAG